MWPKLQVLLQGRSVPRILISYRRRDSAAITGRLYDRLVQKYGASSLFLDIDNILYGPDFRQHVRDALSQTDLVLLIIYLQDADYAALKRKAADRQRSAVELSGELLRAVIRGDIYEAVLDDDG
jgi:hypothetical protein